MVVTPVGCNAFRQKTMQTGGILMDIEIKDIGAEETIKEKPEETVSEESAPEVTEATVEPEIPAEAENEETESIGNIKISVEVVSTIAGIAASEIEGVSCMYTSFVDGFAQRFGAKKSTSKGVKVDMSGDSVSIDLYIVVEYGVKIPELAWEIQDNVKTSVETMTGLPVEKVNIHIEGISFEKDGLDAEIEPEQLTE